MTPAEAISKLDDMPGQVAMFRDIADVIRELQDEVKIVQGWSDKWSTEHRNLTEACKLVLLFHSGSPWTLEKQGEWSNGLAAVMMAHGTSSVKPDWHDATTKNLCNAVRAALKETP